jgi:hypothetical protein
MDVSSIFDLLQQYWLEIGIILAIVFVLRNLKWIAIAVLVFLALSYFGLLDSIKELILSYIPIHLDSLNSHAVPLGLLNDLLNNSVNSTNIIKGG